ncbi:MAG: hypothetical protein IKR18_08295, partial [Bacteroidaceae bacterium]|nr:hypothetical protein [Bacteroidaceae bacterium]
VVRDHKFWQMQMHLDTYFNIIDSNLVTMAQQRVDAQPGEDHYLAADIYTRAKGETAYTKTSTDIPFVGFLRRRGIEIIGLSADDEENFGNNYLCIGPRRIIAPNSVSADYREKMAQAGVVAEYVEMAELTEGNGAAHCMTQVVDR